MPVRLRAKSRSTNMYKDLYGSWTGFTMTVFGASILAGYLAYLYVRMVAGSEDVIKYK